MGIADIFGYVLWPFKWVIEAILVGFHGFWTAIGFDGNDGLTWILSILGLVIVVRSALIPLFVRQIKSQRKMLELAPQLKKIQEKYKGKRDQFSREAMSRETMELYRHNGHEPLLLLPPARRADADLLQPVPGAGDGAEGPGQGRRRPADPGARHLVRQVQPVRCTAARDDRRERERRAGVRDRRSAWSS